MLDLIQFEKDRRELQTQGRERTLIRKLLAALNQPKGVADHQLREACENGYPIGGLNRLHVFPIVIRVLRCRQEPVPWRSDLEKELFWRRYSELRHEWLAPPSRPFGLIFGHQGGGVGRMVVHDTKTLVNPHNRCVQITADDGTHHFVQTLGAFLAAVRCQSWKLATPRKARNIPSGLPSYKRRVPERPCDPALAAIAEDMREYYVYCRRAKFDPKYVLPPNVKPRFWVSVAKRIQQIGADPQRFIRSHFNMHRPRLPPVNHLASPSGLQFYREEHGDLVRLERARVRVKLSNEYTMDALNLGYSLRQILAEQLKLPNEWTENSINRLDVLSAYCLAHGEGLMDIAEGLRSRAAAFLADYPHFAKTALGQFIPPDLRPKPGESV